ncbi:hypothetical protein [Helicobacter sp. MIT 05-5294]|nr:hypothetical protein [Helicobacter sp. MIT 05-5294]
MVDWFLQEMLNIEKENTKNKKHTTDYIIQTLPKDAKEDKKGESL